MTLSPGVPVVYFLGILSGVPLAPCELERTDTPATRDRNLSTRSPRNAPEHCHSFTELVISHRATLVDLARSESSREGFVSRTETTPFRYNCKPVRGSYYAYASVMYLLTLLESLFYKRSYALNLLFNRCQGPTRFILRRELTSSFAPV